MSVETVTLAFRRFTTDDGKRTCAKSKAEQCVFLDCGNFCMFPDASGYVDVKPTATVPHAECPLWRTGQ